MREGIGMKKKILIIEVLMMVLTVVFGTTLAYFTVEAKAVNSITMGSVDLKLHDEVATGEDFPKDGVKDVMPGQSIEKVVYVENVGSKSLFARINIDNSFVEGLTPDFNIKDWTFNQLDQCYYYNKPLAPGEKTETLFETVKVSPSLGNDSKCKSYTIDVIAQGVQVDNNGTDPILASGWPQVD